MPKRVFWPLTVVVMGVVVLASHLGFIPVELIHFWPLVLITVGLGGLFLSDSEEWMVDPTPPTKPAKKAAKKPAKKSAAKRKTTKKTTKKKTTRKK